MKFKAVEHESGAAEILQAEDLDAAIAKAKDWLVGGDWGDEEDYVSFTITDEEGDETEVEIVVGGVQPPKCIDGETHDWQSPYKVVGGLRENPGVWSVGGTQLQIKEVCCNCGRYRYTTTESTPGQYPRTPERVTYAEPDEESKTWAGRNEDEECEDVED